MTGRWPPEEETETQSEAEQGLQTAQGTRRMTDSHQERGLEHVLPQGL